MEPPKRGFQHNSQCLNNKTLSYKLKETLDCGYNDRVEVDSGGAEYGGKPLILRMLSLS